MLSKPIMKYLDQNEAHELKVQLDEAGITSTIKRQGLPRIFGGISNYQVQIDPSDVEVSKVVIDMFKENAARKRSERLHLLTTTCPACSSTDITRVKKNNPFQKIFYYGVTIWRCNRCSAQWYT
ncbi:hypothetical protein CHISP_0727 [Chitinispirillum alkaliphilum]|nr:hypothetical protein CHISP_0727 [Chitinispirillum alkaliphilum]